MTMAGMQPSGANGAPNGVHSHDTPGVRPDTSRPLSFRESLPYSPQTTTLPFVPDLIPNPVLGSGSPALSTLDILPMNELDNLNKEAAGQGRLSKNGKQAVEGVLHELKPHQRTQYKFSAVPVKSSFAPQARSLSDDLSPCAKALFERVGDYFKGTKAKPSPKANGPVKGPLATKEKPSPATPSHGRSNNATPNTHAYRSNSVRIEVAIPAKAKFDMSQYIDPQHPVTSEAMQDGPPVQPVQQLPTAVQSAPPNATLVEQSPGSKNAMFRIELPSADINRDEYMEVAESLEEPHYLSRKKERQDTDNTPGFVGVSLDQRQRADAALNELRRRTEAINRATRAVFEMEPGFDHLVTMNFEQEPALTGEEQKKMYTAIQKVITVGRFNSVPVEDLSQILRLSEASLKEAMSTDIQVDKDWDEASLTAWTQQLPGIDTALKAARTSLRILTGGREDRQLYSESVIERSVKVFQKVTDEIIIPVVEFRNSGASGNVFKMLTKYKKDVSTIFISFQKLLAMLAELVSKVQLTDLALNTLEFVSSNLIFVENAHYEKDSVVGVQKFDGVRSAAMDTLCQIFLIKPAQRQGIISEILSSLSKLPVSKQSSRQFKLSEGGSIQPVSALVMRLIQASAACPDKTSQSRRANMLKNLDGAEGDGADEHQATKNSTTTPSINSENQGGDQPGIALQEANAVSQPLSDEAQQNASLVVGFLVNRAAGSSKSGDTPYRNLLDLFVDDFMVCLDSPDWPAAELLLRRMMSSMLLLFDAEKTAAPVKNMALEVLGNLSAAISRLRSHVKKMAASTESVDNGELSTLLSDLAIQTLDRQSRTEQILSWTGPYRVVLESLQSRAGQDAQLAGAASFILTSWAERLHFDVAEGGSERWDREVGRLAYRLRMMIEDRSWLTNEFEFNTVSANQTKLSYSIILLGLPLCEAFDGMLSILLRSMSSDQATVRSKSLKSVSQVLETDPSILDGESRVVERILECATDMSTQVRESALGLIGSCIQMRPALEGSLIPTIMERVSDAGVSVRRRAMRLARDIYLRNQDKGVRSHIAVGLLRRVIADLDEGVRDAAKQMVEEIWFAPFYNMNDTAAFETSLNEHTALIMRTAKAPGLEHTLDKIFQSILRLENNKLASGPLSVCSRIVSNMFGLINNPSSDDPNVPSGRDALHVLTIFAKAEPKLFTFEQIRLLKPQLETTDVTVAEDLPPYRSMVIILASVLPQLSTVHSDFLQELAVLVSTKLSKLMDHRRILDDTSACLRVILDLTGNYNRAVLVALSALRGIRSVSQRANAAPNPTPKKGSNVKVLDLQDGKRMRAYAALVVTIAEHFDLEPYLDKFKSVFKDFQGNSVARFLVDELEPFASPAQAWEVRRAAIDGISTICQAWPRNYTIPKVYALFQQVFQERDERLELIVLESFKKFLFTEERRSEASGKADGEDKKSLTVMGGTSYDDVASATTQRFLKDITRICLASQGPFAVSALEVLGSINRQGLTHPKETGVTLITLETSSNKLIAELAFKEHKALHEKHESTMEREYTKAVQAAYEYQRDIVRDTRGAWLEPPQPKLHNMMDVLKISKMKNRQRFMEKLCSLIDFDPLAVEASQDIPPRLDFTRFVVENMAFFEYQTVGELQTAVRKLEQIVSGAGAALAQAIDSEIFNVRMDANVDAQIQQQLNEGEGHGQAPEIPSSSVEPARLRQLATASIMLLLIWETRTYLRRLYGMGTSRHDSKAKALAKDLNRTPTKTQGIHWDKFWDETTSLPNGLQSQEAMMQKCKSLVELMSVDSEVKVGDAGDDDLDMDLEAPATPSDGDEDEAEAARGRKRKNNATPGGRKKRPRSSSQVRKRGRLRKNPLDQDLADAESDVDWF